jgi:hypothetical protein
MTTRNQSHIPEKIQPGRTQIFKVIAWAANLEWTTGGGRKVRRVTGISGGEITCNKANKQTVN